MRFFISLNEILIGGSVLCAIIISLGISFGHVDVVEGGAIIVSICGGTAIAKVLSKAKRAEHGG